MPMRASAGSCTASCSTPPTITPPASAITGSTPRRRDTGTSSQAVPMIDRLSSTGVAAGTA